MHKLFTVFFAAIFLCAGGSRAQNTELHGAATYSGTQNFSGASVTLPIGIGATLTGLTSPQMTYTDPGTGAAPVTLYTLFSNAPINVHEFGATGNGSTDDTAALQAALDSGKAQQRAVYLPKGTYKLTNVLTEYWDGMTIFGDGPLTSILNQTGTNKGGLAIPQSSAQNVTLHDFGINDGSFNISTYATTNTGTGLLLNGTAGAGVNLNNLHVYNLGLTGFAIACDCNGIAESVFTNCNFSYSTINCVSLEGNSNSNSFRGCVGSGGLNTAVVWNLQGGAGLEISSGDLQTGHSSTATIGILNSGVSGLRLSGINVECNATGATCYPFKFTGGGSSMENIFIRTNGQTGSYGVYETNAVGVTMSNVYGGLARIDQSGPYHNVVNLTPSSEVVADIYVSGTKTDSYLLQAGTSAGKGPNLFLAQGATGATTPQGAIMWDKYPTGSKYFSLGANQLGVDIFSLQSAGSVDGSMNLVSPTTLFSIAGTTATFSGTLNAQTGLQLNGSSVATLGAQTFTGDQTLGGGHAVILAGETGTPGTNVVGGVQYNGATHWLEGVDVVFGNDWGILRAHGGGTGNARDLVVDCDLSENWHFGWNNTGAAGSQPTGTAGLNNYQSTMLGAAGTSFTRIRHGQATLASGTVTVSDANVTASTRVFCTLHTLGTITTPAALGVTARTPGTGFTITSSAGTDTSVVDWLELEP